MKKINSNVTVFLTAVIIVICGLASREMWQSAAECVKSFFANAESVGVAAAFDTFTADMEKTATDKLSCHHAFMDINSAVMRLSNTRVVEKDDSTVVKTASGYLANPRGYIDDDELHARAEKVKKLYEAAEANGSGFLYVMAPCKGYYLDYPPNIEDYTKSNCDRFAAALADRGVPVLNFEEYMKNNGISDESAFFVTDHHWKPEFAFEAVGEICRTLNALYGFEYSEKAADISNFTVTKYENWFLGSQGKKVGRYFTSPGTDDISIILPGFDTHMTEEQPAKGLLREGSFAETVMYTENIAVRDFYGLNPYAAYSGGDFREQIITNKDNPDGASMLLIRDSFGCAAAPFVSLHTSTLCVTDVRDYAYYVGDKINVYDYIKEKNPDFVTVLYNGVSSGDDLFDFD